MGSHAVLQLQQEVERDHARAPHRAPPWPFGNHPQREYLETEQAVPGSAGVSQAPHRYQLRQPGPVAMVSRLLQRCCVRAMLRPVRWLQRMWWCLAQLVAACPLLLVANWDRLRSEPVASLRTRAGRTA